MLEPRYYNNSTGMIQDQYEEVFEVIFLTEGRIAVGYKILDQEFYASQIVMSKKKKIVTPVNDNSCMLKTVSEFMYKSIDLSHGLAVRSYNFRQIMSEPIAKKMVIQLKMNYKFQIHNPVTEHRNHTFG